MISKYGQKSDIKSRKSYQGLETRFDEAYQSQVLKYNQVRGDVPSHVDQLRSFTELIQQIKNEKQKKEQKENLELVAHIETRVKEKCQDLIQAKITHQTKHNCNLWCQLFSEICIFCEDLIDSKNGVAGEKIRDLIMCATHYQLKFEILKKLVILHNDDIRKIEEKINAMQKKEWKDFGLRVYHIEKANDIAKNVSQWLEKEISDKLKYELRSAILWFVENKENRKTSKQYMDSAFENAFSNSDCHKAFRLIVNPVEIMDESILAHFDNLKEALLDCSLPVTKNETFGTYFQDMAHSIINSWIQACQNFKSMIEIEAKSALKKSIAHAQDAQDGQDVQNAQKAQRLSEFRARIATNPITLERTWKDYIVKDWIAFSNTLINRLTILRSRIYFTKGYNNDDENKYDQESEKENENENEEKMVPISRKHTLGKEENFLVDIINSQFDKCVTSRYVYCIGCRARCPKCKSKCQREYMHAGNHCTECHYLQAFAGVRNVDTGKLNIDVCNSDSNSKSLWYYDNIGTKIALKFGMDNNRFVRWTWDEMIKAKHKKWHPIEKSNFNKEKVYMMLEMFFRRGLQQRLIKYFCDCDKSANDKEQSTNKYKMAQENDNGCQNEAQWPDDDDNDMENSINASIDTIKSHNNKTSTDKPLKKNFVGSANF